MAMDDRWEEFDTPVEPLDIPARKRALERQYNCYIWATKERKLIPITYMELRHMHNALRHVIKSQAERLSQLTECMDVVQAGGTAQEIRQHARRFQVFEEALVALIVEFARRGEAHVAVPARVLPARTRLGLQTAIATLQDEIKALQRAESAFWGGWPMSEAAEDLAEREIEGYGERRLMLEDLIADLQYVVDHTEDAP